MLDQSFIDEIEARIAGFIVVEQHDDRRWSAALLPDAICLTGGDVGPLPPGQIVQIGDGYIVYNELMLLPSERRSSAARTGEFKQKWAARPFFRSREAAMRMMIGWIRKNRQDIVDECYSETLAAINWRVRQRRKSETRA